ncbi:hypothetical protein GGF46_005091 [Coemansia sp. RSA 552]|nr:hypothetical protein GGF46_005091 [Coemansia sp. RSA 552]
MSSLEDESRKRKARLQKLGGVNVKAGSEGLKLRNYTTEVEKETGISRPNPEGGDERAPDTVESSVSGLVEATISERREAVENRELDMAAIAPKRANWDLKQDLQGRLDELKQENDVAVADIIRKRIQNSGSTEDIAHVVQTDTRG